MTDLPSRDAVRHSDNIHDFPTYLERVLLPLAQAWQSGRLVDRETINVEAVAAVEHDQWERGSTVTIGMLRWWRSDDDTVLQAASTISERNGWNEDEAQGLYEAVLELLAIVAEQVEG